MAPKSRENWVRSGGAYGDPSMEQLEAFISSGGGVSEVSDVTNTDPNDGVTLKQQKGTDA